MTGWHPPKIRPRNELARSDSRRENSGRGSPPHEVQPAEPDVSEKPKRRWFQFSLRAMLIVMTLVAIVLGRVAYLRQMAVYHDREQARHLGEWRQGYESFDKGLSSAAAEARKR